MPQPRLTPVPPTDRLATFQPRFPLGRVVATPGALKQLEQHGIDALDLLARHVVGDWGEVCAEDAQANDTALMQGNRLLSAYALSSGEVDTRIWIITEWDRSLTTLLLPSEY
jgi:hypothetical protein